MLDLDALSTLDPNPEPFTPHQAVLSEQERGKDNPAPDAYHYDYPRMCYHADAAFHATLTDLVRPREPPWRQLRGKSEFFLPQMQPPGGSICLPPGRVRTPY